MEKAALISGLLAFAISALLSAILIPHLTRLKFGQTERQEGVSSHLKKAGTPTMGGLAFLAAVLVVSLIQVKDYPRIAPVLILTIGFGVIGFLDDYLKITKHDSDGLLAWQKLLLQILFTTLYLLYNHFILGLDLSIRLPFTGGRMVEIGPLAIVLAYFAVIGTVNGVNFTDGLDGLCSTVTLVVAIFFFASSQLLGTGVTPMAGAMAGALLGFLLFNAYPAKVFMGDTGSLALGGFVAGMAYMQQMPLFIPIIGIIYLWEVLSVIIQVSYFKLTHGKRVFKMSPFHHHLELCGWSETRIVACFAAVTAVACTLALLGL